MAFEIGDRILCINGFIPKTGTQEKAICKMPEIGKIYTVAWVYDKCVELLEIQEPVSLVCDEPPCFTEIAFKKVDEAYAEGILKDISAKAYKTRFQKIIDMLF